MMSLNTRFSCSFFPSCRVAAPCVLEDWDLTRSNISKPSFESHVHTGYCGCFHAEWSEVNPSLKLVNAKECWIPGVLNHNPLQVLKLPFCKILPVTRDHLLSVLCITAVVVSLS